MLEGLGLLPEQEETYRQLLGHPRLSIVDIMAERPEWSPAQTERVLRSLVQLGLAVQIDQTGTRYAAISPDMAIAGLVRARINAARSTLRTSAVGCAFNSSATM